MGFAKLVQAVQQFLAKKTTHKANTRILTGPAWLCEGKQYIQQVDNEESEDIFSTFSSQALAFGDSLPPWQRTDL